MNARVGDQRINNTVGPHGLGTINDRGERWAEWCTTNNQVIMNTWFQLPKRRKYTWVHPSGKSRSQIDYITINDRFRNAVKRTQTYPGADCGSDHILLAAKVAIKPKKLTQKPITKRLDYERLTKDEELKHQYSDEVQR